MTQQPTTHDDPVAVVMQALLDHRLSLFPDSPKPLESYRPQAQELVRRLGLDQRPVEDHPLPDDLTEQPAGSGDLMEPRVCVACGSEVEWVAAVDGDGGWWDHANRAAAVGPHRAIVEGCRA